MNIKAKLILAATAVSLLSTPALAFRDMGDAGGDSAFAIPENHGYSRHNTAPGYVYRRWERLLCLCVRPHHSAASTSS